MRQKELLDSIKTYLARFEAQVKISNLNGEYDINIHSENVIIPLLNIIFNKEFLNANYSEKKNNEVIDLIDKDEKIGIQVTSTTNIEKIKGTLTKFLSSKYKNKLETLYIYTLRGKQNSYNQSSFDKIIGKQIKFNAKEHIIDASFLYNKINADNNLNTIAKIEEILRNQFSDIFINKTFTLSELEDFKVSYKKSCVSNFSRINFFGLSVSATKPREIELYSLFVNPIFSTNQRYSDLYTEHNENDIVFSRDLYFPKIEIGITRESNTELLHFNTIDSINNSLKNLDIDITKYFGSKVINLASSQLPNFKDFYIDLNKSEQIFFADLFSGHKNIVVIGSPGAGKSSFIKYAICKILENDQTVFTNKDLYEFIPFRIELHKYNKFKKEKNGGILEYLHELLKSEYQYTLLLENISSIIKTFPTFFFFDGLDEIFDIQERLSVRNDIESFLTQYTKLRSIVTSRFESYEEVSLSEKLFAKYQLLDFIDDQVIEYVNRWYDVEESDEKLRKSESKNCLIQLETVDSSLKHNPLLLSLILLLYRSELDIPTSKLHIYESCTNTIVETRDVKEKKLDIKLKIVNKISVFASLAYWQFTNESKGLMPYNFEGVRNYIKQYLLNKGEFEDEYVAQQATDEFLEFAKVRSIYFENKFTHKTFLEYFTAYYIFSYYYNNWKKGEEFSGLISEYIGLSAWSVVLELLICKIDAAQIDYDVIDDIIDTQYQRNKIDSLIFFVQILKYLKNISPKKTKNLIDNTIKFCFKDGETTKDVKLDYKEILFSNLTNLVSIERFREIIEDSFKNFILENSDQVNKLYVFAYEFAIVSGNTNLVNILELNKLESNDEYTFILKHYPNLFDKSKYIESLKLFNRTYDSLHTSKIYKSSFNQKIFFGSEKFNWCLSYLSKNLHDTDIYKLWNDIIKSGIPEKTIIDSAKYKSAIIIEHNLHTNSNRKNSKFKNFLRILQKTYYPNSMILTTHHSKFYDNFFLKYPKKK